MPSEKLFNRCHNMYDFKKNDGTNIKKWELLKQILDCIGNKKLQIPSIAKELNIPLLLTKHAVEHLYLKDKLSVHESSTRNNFYYIPKKQQCLLAEILYPKSLVDNFKVKKILRHSMDNSRTVSYPLLFKHVYTSINTVYD